MGRPGFGRLCQALADGWGKNRDSLLAQAKRLTGAVAMYANETVTSGPAALDVTGWVAGALEEQRERFDSQHGGVGSSPKFPPHPALHLWLALLARGQDPEGVRGMLEKTLDGMMRGGIYDQVGGGFHRYATDEQWLVPHFEKMLYDNALLAGAYALAAVKLGREDYAGRPADARLFPPRNVLSGRAWRTGRGVLFLARCRFRRAGRQVLRVDRGGDSPGPAEGGGCGVGPPVLWRQVGRQLARRRRRRQRTARGGGGFGRVGTGANRHPVRGLAECSRRAGAARTR